MQRQITILRAGLVALAVASALVATGTNVAAAQPPEPSADTLERARELFEQGAIAAEQDGRWADAYRLFAESYELSHRPQALFNAALAQRALGQHVEARDSFDRLIRRHLDADAEFLARVREYRAEEAARVATIHLMGFEAELEVRLRLDGRSVDPRGAGRRRDLETNPGHHSVVIEAEDHEAFTWDGVLVDGQALEVPFSLEPLERARRVVDSPWLWVAIGVVVVGAGIGTYFGIDAAVQVDPRPNVPVVEL